MSEVTQVKYTGTTPGEDANTYNIFSTVSAFTGKSQAQMCGVNKVAIDIKHDEALTFKWYKSDDRGTTWLQVDQAAVAAPASTESTWKEFAFEPFPDFKVDIVNGGTAQAVWSVTIALLGERSTPS